jgi:hypothetical protein
MDILGQLVQDILEVSGDIDPLLFEGVEHAIRYFSIDSNEGFLIPWHRHYLTRKRPTQQLDLKLLEDLWEGFSGSVPS